MKKLYIFDWDGTLVDSTGMIVQAMQQAIADVALPSLEPSAISHIIGLGLAESVQALYPEAEPGQHQQLAERYRYHFVNDPAVPAFFPGVESTLATLRDRGAHLAVATGKSRRGLDRVWQALGLSDFFDFSRCCDEARSKPHPQMLWDILAVSGYAPAEAIMVGDTTHDIKMAQNAGVSTVAVSYGAHPEALLAEAQPERLIHHFGELLN